MFIVVGQGWRAAPLTPLGIPDVPDEYGMHSVSSPVTLTSTGNAASPSAARSLAKRRQAKPFLEQHPNQCDADEGGKKKKKKKKKEEVKEGNKKRECHTRPCAGVATVHGAPRQSIRPDNTWM